MRNLTHIAVRPLSKWPRNMLSEKRMAVKMAYDHIGPIINRKTFFKRDTAEYIIRAKVVVTYIPRNFLHFHLPS